MDDGGPIQGEEATLARSFAYAAPRRAIENNLTRLVRTVLREHKRQVLPT